jgi:putative aldouronate transport system permease protein
MEVHMSSPPAQPSMAGGLGQPTAPRRSARRLLRTVGSLWQLYLLVSVPTAFLIVFNYLPMVGAQVAFRDWNPLAGIWGSPWIGTQEFSSFFSSPFFWPIIQNTLVLGLYSLLVSTPATILLALFLNEVKHGWYKKLVQTATFVPYFISVVVLIGTMDLLLNPDVGLVSQFFGLFGRHAPDLLGDPSAFPSLYVWSGIWQFTGWGAVIYLAALSNVSPSLYEAAMIDGASRWQRTLHIDWPAIKPTVIVLTILAAGNVMAVGFEKVYIMQNPLNLGTSEVINTYVYKIGLVNDDFSFSAAVGLFNSTINFALILAVNFVARWVSDTSLF